MDEYDFKTGVHKYNIDFNDPCHVKTPESQSTIHMYYDAADKVLCDYAQELREAGNSVCFIPSKGEPRLYYGNHCISGQSDILNFAKYLIIDEDQRIIDVTDEYMKKYKDEVSSDLILDLLKDAYIAGLLEALTWNKFDEKQLQ